MKLPNCEQAIVAREKITEYLLAPMHEEGGSKQAFFSRFGFQRSAWEVLAVALRTYACMNEVTEVTTTTHGVKYRIDGPVDAPDGRTPSVRSIWIVEHGELLPRFVTAYPSRETRA